MAISLPVRIRTDGVRVAVETDPLHAPLRDFLLNDLGEDISAILRAQGRLNDDRFEPWQEIYRYHRLDFDGTIVHVRDVAGWASCDLEPAVLRRCLDEYLRQVGDLQSRRGARPALSAASTGSGSAGGGSPVGGSPAGDASGGGSSGAGQSGTGPSGTGPSGEPVATSLALGSVSQRTQGWRLVQTPRAVLEDMAGLTPHPDSCLPHGVLGTGSGATWADLAVLDGTHTRLRSGTKTFMPRGIDPERIITELGNALTQARFLRAVPGAWYGFVAGVPVYGYVDPDLVLRLPCEPISVGGVMQRVRVFFPELADSGVDLEFAALTASAFTSSVYGPRHVLTAFLLHDVQSHRHHMEVVRAARPGWEHTGNVCHLRLDVQTVRLEHLWLPGHACEMPTGEFARVLDEYERLIALAR